ncbi:Uncharacterized protein FWK35_00016844 [Aphis craccivora]|uniref:Uncharacterized protein n=1 Tax=Aphis craccivora TaxID=307492 RepID=A0A6G0Y3T3_APHCR|nr:Uncharacterized protein FWK35_00016844 [Aphis craccivora]
MLNVYNINLPTVLYSYGNIDKRIYLNIHPVDSVKYFNLKLYYSISMHDFLIPSSPPGSSQLLQSSITSRNNAPISNFGGGFRSMSEYPWCIIEVKS